jgi:hypothetical protein
MVATSPKSSRYTTLLQVHCIWAKHRYLVTSSAHILCHRCFRMTTKHRSLNQEARWVVAERSTDLTEPLCRSTIKSKEEEVETLGGRGGHGEEGEEKAQAA